MERIKQGVTYLAEATVEDVEDLTGAVAVFAWTGPTSGVKTCEISGNKVTGGMDPVETMTEGSYIWQIRMWFNGQVGDIGTGAIQISASIPSALTKPTE